MIKVVATIRRKPGMTVAEFHAYLHDVHGELGRRNPLGMRRYVQNHAIDSAYGSGSDAAYGMALPRDSASELYYDDVPGMLESFADPYVRDVVGPDGDNFADNPTNLSFVGREIVDREPTPSPRAVKAMIYVRAGQRIDAADFEPQWAAAHQSGLDALGTALEGSIRSLPIDLPPEIADYFRAEAATDYHGIASLWLDGENAVVSVRRYLAAAESTAGPDLFDSPRGFFLITREVPIFDLTTSNDAQKQETK